MAAADRVKKSGRLAAQVSPAQPQERCDLPLEVRRDVAAAANVREELAEIRVIGEIRELLRGVGQARLAQQLRAFRLVVPAVFDGHPLSSPGPG
eukprot:CAMPEP_0180314432 /NCGR_PEP_ID=MMETSP0988-20121125/32037_1 /TAXON_ID=697907 /ORGANISM="non described non described, Strain CCMP2293" /LENGTH=93 /DNA_ID=CAMNT_0022299093 /DNA_START=19 /DNA_END=298 /DNA_ORIENTATION=-